MSLNVPKDWEKDKDKILQSEKRAHYFHSFLVNFTRCKVLVERLLKVSLIFFWNTWNVWRISMRVLGIVINWNGGCFPYSSRKLFFQIFYLVKDFCSKFNQIRSFLRFWSHLLKKSSWENFIFWVVLCLIT